MMVKEVYIKAFGDPSVGIPETDAVISSLADDFVLDLGVLAEEDRGPALDNFKQKIGEAFTEAWGEPVQVITVTKEDDA